MSRFTLILTCFLLASAVGFSLEADYRLQVKAVRISSGYSEHWNCESLFEKLQADREGRALAKLKQLCQGQNMSGPEGFDEVTLDSCELGASLYTVSATFYGTCRNPF